ncbi:MAG: NAD(P)H-dependent oxidoreductase subunit E [Vicinamibacterales bacterium]
MTDETIRTAVEEALARAAGRPGALLEVLHAVQASLGCIPRAAVTLVAEGMNLSRADVHGVVSFYHVFREQPPGRHVVQVCRAESCQAAGGSALEAHVQSVLGVAFGDTTSDTTSDGAITLLPVYCLGNCARSPAVLVDGDLHGPLTPEAFSVLVSGLRHDAAAPAGATVDATAAATAVAPSTAESTTAAVTAAVPAAVPVGGSLAGPLRAGDRRDALVPVARVASVGATAHPTTHRVRVFVPGDSGALSAGADGTSAAIRQHAAAQGLAIELVRTGSRGMYWLEPLVEVETDAGRIAYGPVTASDVQGLLRAGLAQGAAHPLCLGPVHDIPYLARQQRLTFARVGEIDPLSIGDYEAHGGLAGLRRALEMAPSVVVAEVTASGLRGRGGAAFPAGTKWQTVLDQAATPKYIACNADEGDSGTFSDRMLMEGDPFALLEGMAIAGLAVGATQGYIYLRVEYPHAHAVLAHAVARAYEAGLLGDLLGSGRRFDLEIRLGAGAYICGEETSMLESLEGRRGEVRVRPPLPAVAGLFQRPTVVNNVITLASVPGILARGAAHYRDLGAGESRGTLPFQLAGNVRYGGLVEAPFGLTLRQLVEDFGGGTRSGRPVKAVQVGGPLGAYIPASGLDVPLDYESLARAGGLLGHGGVVVFDDTVDMAAMARHAMAFCAHESCGKCTPCRLGSVRGVELVDRIVAGADPVGDVALLEELCDTMRDGSLCGLGGLTPYPVMSALTHFRAEFVGRGR